MLRAAAGSWKRSRRSWTRAGPPATCGPKVTAEDIAASLIGIFIVVGQPGQQPRGSRLLNLLSDGLMPGGQPL